jgi:hypothetical protein
MNGDSANATQFGRLDSVPWNPPASQDILAASSGGNSMADDKSKTGKQDRVRVAGQDDEVQHLAKEAGVTSEQARSLIKAYGNDGEKLMKAAKALASPKPRSSRT